MSLTEQDESQVENGSDRSVRHLSDEVIARIAQALQEAMLLGQDVTESLRSMQLTVAGDEITLAPGYAESVARSHEKLLSDLVALKRV